MKKAMVFLLGLGFLAPLPAMDPQRAFAKGQLTDEKIDAVVKALASRFSKLVTLTVSPGLRLNR